MPVFVLHRSMTSLKSWAAAFLAEEALFCALLDPAAPYSSTKTALSPGAHTSCWACPAVSLLFVLWVLAEFPLSWFSWTLSLTKKAHFRLLRVNTHCPNSELPFYGKFCHPKSCLFFFFSFFNQNKTVHFLDFPWECCVPDTGFRNVLLCDSRIFMLNYIHFKLLYNLVLVC